MKDQSGLPQASHRPSGGELLGGFATLAGAGVWALYSHLTGDLHGGFYPFAATILVVTVGGVELADRWRDDRSADPEETA